MEQQVAQNTQETQTTSTTAAAVVEKPKSKTGTAIKIVAGAGILGGAAYAFKKYVWDAGLLDDILGKSTEEEVVDTAVNTFIGLFK